MISVNDNCDCHVQIYNISLFFFFTFLDISEKVKKKFPRVLIDVIENELQTTKTVQFLNKFLMK
jgi:hypothetical protein